MASLPNLKTFAAEHNFGLTKPLRHEQVVTLAETWKPEMHFYWDEKFFPISLHEAISMVEDVFGTLAPTERSDWRVVEFVRGAANSGVERTFDPPVVHVPDGLVAFAGLLRPAVRVLTEGSPANEALARTEVGSDAVVTHGADARKSDKFFGPLTTVKGKEKASPGDPYLPRADEPNPQSPPDRRSHFTIMAALLNLVDLLKYELIIAEANDIFVEPYPPDGMRGGFDVVNSLLHPTSAAAPPLTPAMQRQLLLAQIASYESGGTIPPPVLPPGWTLDRVGWDAVLRYTFLEYDFFYAYNDFDRYQDTFFENEHEGDDEGCCLVFDRGAINLAAASSDSESLKWVVPHAVITSVHEEFQNADGFKMIPPLPSPPGTADSVRDLVGLHVYIAGGSHATYLTSGNHPLVDFGDFGAVAEDNLAALIVLGPLIIPIAILLLIFEHFRWDTQDFTSDDGIHSAPGEPVEGDPLGMANRVIVLPMSAGNHIYDGRDEHEELLRLRAFAGKWGGHDGLIDKSPIFHAKSGRYFRKLLANL